MLGTILREHKNNARRHAAKFESLPDTENLNYAVRSIALEQESRGLPRLMV